MGPETIRIGNYDYEPGQFDDANEEEQQLPPPIIHITANDLEKEFGWNRQRNDIEDEVEEDEEEEEKEEFSDEDELAYDDNFADATGGIFFLVFLSIFLLFLLFNLLFYDQKFATF